MAPLVGYDSSDEEEEIQQSEAAEQAVAIVQNTQSQQQQEQEEAVGDEAKQPLPSPSQPQLGPSLPPSAASIGPSLPPEDETQAYPEPDEVDPDDFAQEDDSQPPTSPYTANRSLIHNLTLPTVPNLDIPPSPPASPSSATAQAALTARIDKFLELKRKKGTHFNAKIAESHALKNPPLMDKLLDFVGMSTAAVDQGPGEQYATTLPTELWDPAAFPQWAYRGPLRKSQERLQKEKGREKGEAVQFVSASS